MAVLFSNNAATTLASSVSSSATSITVADGAVFPAVSSGDYFYVTLEDVGNTKREIVKCTARSSNTLTIVRAQDSTTAQTFSSSDKAELRLTAAALNAATSSNDFTNADHSKLDGIEASADVTDAGNVVAALTAGSNVAIAADGTISSTDTNTTYSIQDGELSQNNFTNADHTKLNNIETSADVTDATNVGAAGALMDSEVTNLAEVKAFDSSDYATAAQGTLAANALPKAGGTLTGALVLNGTGSLKLPVGTTAQREASASAGMLRYNSTTSKLESYTNTWKPVGDAADFNLNAFTGNGSVVAYTLSTSPSEDNTLVYIDGVYQNKTSYAIVDNVLTFSGAPESGASIEITAATVAPVIASTEFKLSQFTGNGSATAFSLSEATPENNTNVYWDGVYQSKANYSVSGTTLTFSTAPPNGVAVEVMAAHAVVVSVSTPDDNTVSTVKIVNSAVTTAKIADGAITSAKLGAGVGGAFNDFAIKTSAYTAVTRDQLIVNSSSTVTITLPASPAAGNVVFIKNAGTGTVTVGRNGSKINSQTQDGTLAADAAATLVFVDATIGWKEL